MSQILIVDDEVGIRELLSEILRDEGHDVFLAENASQARMQRTRYAPDLVLLDIWMPDSDGVTLLKEWATTGLLTMPVVMMSGHGTIDTAVEATRIGAFAFLEKPIALQKLLNTVGSALASRQTNDLPQAFALTGKSPAATRLRAQIERIQNLSGSVLFAESPGAGADQCAGAMRKKARAWVEINNPGHFETVRNDIVPLARQGALYLREVHSYSLEQQFALMAMMGELEAAEVRILSSTSVSLSERIAAGEFDARLYALLSGTVIHVPALHERIDDIADLATAMLVWAAKEHETTARRFDQAALDRLRGHQWPGNLVQLQAIVTSCARLVAGTEIAETAVGQILSEGEPTLQPDNERLNLDRDLRAAREDFERVYFEYHLGRENGNMSKVANRAGLERTHLYRKIKQLGIKVSRRVED